MGRSVRTELKEFTPLRSWAGVAQAWDRTAGNCKVRASPRSPDLAWVLCSEILFLFPTMRVGELLCVYVQLTL